MVRVLDELLWALRREGFEISTAQAIDAARALEAAGLQRRGAVANALSAVVVQRACDRDRFDAAFDRFFTLAAGDDRQPSLWNRLAGRGFERHELDVLQALAAQVRTDGGVDFGRLVALLDRGPDLDRSLVLSGVARDLDAHSGPQLGFITHRLLSRVGVAAARRTLAALRVLLIDALGSLRGGALADALAQELERTDDEVRAYLRASHQARVDEARREGAERHLATTPFAALTQAEIDEVRRAVRGFAEKLRGGARVRANRQAFRGRIDPHRTMRRAMRTGGVPFEVARRDRRRERPKLVVLCDVSDSVRATACFFLEFTYAVQELFERARTFAFVSDIEETTRLFASEPVRTAVARAWGGGATLAGENSNYGRVFRTFEARYSRELDRRTVVVILGDGRTNYHDAGAEVLDRIRERSRALIWLCPEPHGDWGQGDSAMATYARKCTAVHEVRCARDLERAARSVLNTH
jgi:uncharacterized protein with von Willebrand factor type A (vWA) domain